MTREELAEIQRREKARVEMRKGTLSAWNDYIAFFTSKVVGAGCFLGGGAELLAPDVLPIVLGDYSIWVAAGGLALLTGKNIIKLITTINDTFEGKK